MSHYIEISDVSLRDGNHAVSHQLSCEHIFSYAKKADTAGPSYIEVGHGNGIGASSFQVGLALHSDLEMIQAARKAIKKRKLSVHAIPGFATLDKDIKPALEKGVDTFRIASHCTEADTTETHISFLHKNNIEVLGVLMMSHMASKEGLLESAKLMQAYGASAVILMDSAGAYLPEDVKKKVSFLVDHLSIKVGFHAHNNLGLAVSNSILAAECGATLLDASSRGFGAGAGNCPIEILVPLLHKLGYKTSADAHEILDLADFAESTFIQTLPFSKTLSICTGLAGLFSGFAKPIQKMCDRYQVDPKKVIEKMGSMQVVAGQEDSILEAIKSVLEDDPKKPS